jgi:hypothetical protein
MYGNNGPDVPLNNLQINVELGQLEKAIARKDENTEDFAQKHDAKR